MALAADPGAAPLHPSTLSSHVQRATCNLQPLIPSRLSPHASRRSPLPKPLRTGGVPRRGHTRQCGRTCRCTPPRCRPTFNVQRATFNPSSPHASRLSPLASPQTLEDGRSPPARAHTPVRAHMSVHPTRIDRAASLVLGTHTSAGAHVGAPLHVVVRRSTCNVQPSTPHASRLNNSPADPSRRRGSPPGRRSR